jgi:hypothetical protein
MEERLTPELWLELSALSPDQYASELLPRLAAAPGFERVSWWANARPNRGDLPRTMDEFATLGLFEPASDASAGDAGGAGDLVLPDGVVRLRFRRTQRPGQGVLTGEPTLGLLLVLISPTAPDEAQVLRDWADFVHIRHIAAAAVPGYGMITPYERCDLGYEDGPARFLHLYEIHNQDAESVYRSMVPLVVARIGEPGSAGWDEWAGHPALRIDYVNTFRRAGTWPA